MCKTLKACAQMFSLHWDLLSIGLFILFCWFIWKSDEPVAPLAGGLTIILALYLALFVLAKLHNAAHPPDLE